MSAVHARKLADIIVAYQQDPERFVGTAGLVGTVSAAACGYAVCGNFIDAAASAGSSFHLPLHRFLAAIVREATLVDSDSGEGGGGGGGGRGGRGGERLDGTGDVPSGGEEGRRVDVILAACAPNPIGEVGQVGGGPPSVRPSEPPAGLPSGASAHIDTREEDATGEQGLRLLGCIEAVAAGDALKDNTTGGEAAGGGGEAQRRLLPSCTSASGVG